MGKTISIIGYGWLGKQVAFMLLKEGYRVYASTTSPEKLEEIERSGVNAILYNMSDPLPDVVAKSAVVLNLTTSKETGQHENFVTSLSQASCRVIRSSSTSVYKARNKVVTENSELEENEQSQIESVYRKHIPQERLVLLRLAGLFGEDRSPGLFLRRSKAIRSPQGFINLVHGEDVVKAIISLCQEWKSGTFNICSTNHPKREIFYQAACKIEKIEITLDEDNAPFKIVDSQKSIENLGIDYYLSNREINRILNYKG